MGKELTVPNEGKTCHEVEPYEEGAYRLASQIKPMNQVFKYPLCSK